MDKNYFVCLICCEEFSGGCVGGDLGRKEENVQSLQQFCKVILGKDRNELKGREEVDKNKLSKFLENEDDNLSICGNCLDLIETVTEARLSAKCVEESVEKLQMLLLRELRRLQGRLDMFWGEFKKMEETLATGDLKFLENRLDGSYFKKKEESNKLTKTLGKMTREHLKRKNEIFGFRGKISKVFRGFHQFKSNLDDKVACTPVSQTIRTATSTRKRIDAQVQVEINQKFEHKLANKQKQQAHHEGLSSFPSAFDKTEDEDNGGDMEDEPMHLDNFDDGNFEDNQVEKKIVDKQMSLRRREKKKCLQNVSNSGEDDELENSGDDNDGKEFNSEEVSKISNQNKTKRFRLRRRDKVKKKYMETSSDSDENEEAQKQKWSEDDDDEYEPEEPLDETPTYRAQIRDLLREYEPHLAQLPPFKRNLVNSVLKCQCQHQNMQKRKGPENMNAYHRHMVFLSYNVETQLLNLKDVPIKILSQAEENPEDLPTGNGLLCSKCGFNVPDSTKMQTLMYDHVLSQHLNAYQCPHCKEKKLESYEKFKRHVWKCRHAPDAFKVSCDICGKILCEMKALKNHKWKFHMSDQERKDALESGLFKKAPEMKSTKGMEKRFQCEQCGKSFVSPSNLHEHEITHQDRESREQFICPKCGKSFLKAGFEYHSKHSVTCGEDDNGGRKETCGKCGKSFKNIWHLKRHVKEMHVKAEMRGDSKPFVCGTCGKAFGRKGGLRKHELTHSGEKSWICENCGAAFSTKYNLRRHKATCAK